MDTKMNSNCDMLAAIRNLHPEWVTPDGQCSACESYLHELAAHPSNLDSEPSN